MAEDVEAHIAEVPNGRRVWLDRLLGEGARVVLVVILALGGAYLTLHREVTNVEQTFAAHDREDIRTCHQIERIRSNQETVLLTLLTLVDVLDDRSRTPRLQELPRSLRQAIFHALSALPDQRNCARSG